MTKTDIMYRLSDIHEALINGDQMDAEEELADLINEIELDDEGEDLPPYAP